VEGGQDACLPSCLAAHHHLAPFQQTADALVLLLSACLVPACQHPSDDIQLGTCMYTANSLFLPISWDVSPASCTGLTVNACGEYASRTVIAFWQRALVRLCLALAVMFAHCSGNGMLPLVLPAWPPGHRHPTLACHHPHHPQTHPVLALEQSQNPCPCPSTLPPETHTIFTGTLSNYWYTKSGPSGGYS